MRDDNGSIASCGNLIMPVQYLGSGRLCDFTDGRLAFLSLLDKPVNQLCARIGVGAGIKLLQSFCGFPDLKCTDRPRGPFERMGSDHPVITLAVTAQRCYLLGQLLAEQ